ncbi:N-acetylglutamate synthase [Klebsiella variicola]|nr:N-acetylglutamate synthase [Klebsiella variicola]
MSVTGESFNLTSEEIATQLAIKLKAEKMIGFCSSQGVYNQAGEIVSELFPNEAQARVEELEADEDYNSGTRALPARGREGLPQRRAALPPDQLSGKWRAAAGAVLTRRHRHPDRHGERGADPPGDHQRYRRILELISPLEQQGILVRRSREQLEMEIDKFTIIQRDNTTIACAALYPFPEEKIGEMACVAVHPDYRSSSRGEVLLERIAAQARQMGLSKLFVLTTRSIHWFQERGFTPVDIDLLPESKKQMYNYQRRSKVLMADLA